MPVQSEFPLVGQVQPEEQYLSQPMALETGNGSLLQHGQFGNVVTSGFPGQGLRGGEPNPLERPSAGSTVSFPCDFSFFGWLEGWTGGCMAAGIWFCSLGVAL
jgi:hypothetical protein